MILPRYPIYIPSKGRAEIALTARALRADGVPFRLVVEPQEEVAYANGFGADSVLVLPFSNKGSVIPARNWIKDHAISEGAAWHWQLDDNISAFRRWYKGQRIYCDAGLALAVLEDFVDRYENIAVAGLDYTCFAVARTDVPLLVNHRIYSCSLVRNDLPFRWRGRYNEDTDLCLQVLSCGWCTVLLRAFLVDKKATMTLRGGNTTALYKGDGRLKMARSLERMWPGVVETKRRFQRPQHVVYDEWRRFDTPLKRRADAGPIRDYGIRLERVQDVPLGRGLEEWYRNSWSETLDNHNETW